MGAAAPRFSSWRFDATRVSTHRQPAGYDHLLPGRNLGGAALALVFHLFQHRATPHTLHLQLSPSLCRVPFTVGIVAIPDVCQSLEPGVMGGILVLRLVPGASFCRGQSGNAT